MDRSALQFRLRHLRQKKGLTLRALEELSGVSNAYISQLERGIGTNPSIDNMERLASALDVKPSYLLWWTEAREKDQAQRIVELERENEELRRRLALVHEILSAPVK